MENIKASADPFLWLEDIDSERALAWVRAQNQPTLELLQADPRYARFYDAALTIATSKARIPFGSIRNGYVYNFWQDEDHERGLWRRVKLADYDKPEPSWEILLDIDELAAHENANWVYKGVNCLPPEHSLCLVSLSDGGKDAVRIREFDILKKSFVSGGFDIPEAKSDVIFESQDSLLIATDWGEGTLTESGYPFVVKRLQRGRPLSDAVELYRGAKEDVAASPFELENAAGRRWFGASRAETFFTASYFLFQENRPAIKIPIPPKATPKGLFADEFLFTLEQDWTPEGQSALKTGDLAHFGWSAFIGSGKLPKVELMMRPSARQAIQGIDLSKDAVLITLSDNVALKIIRCVKSSSGWSMSEVALPAKGVAEVSFADVAEKEAFLTFEGFLDPDALYRYDAGAATLKQIKSLPAWFDAASYRVNQYEAISQDGTPVPYFTVYRKDLPFDGSNPTLIHGYGGFQVSETPYYSGVIGKLWLEQGGVFALANIRGGGEFGPAWHQAGLKLKRQVVYDDFIAIAEDLIARQITRKEKLGAVGGSNGGLLMGVMFTQRPDLFKAIVCQVPLLDMLRYHLLLAGASWMDEYGDPDVPEERAFLEKLSPYHNIDPDKTYPEIYFETSTKDDRVHPGHARKMAKRLEALGKPFLYYENIDGGHSAAANQREVARRAALEYTYLARQLID